MAVVMAAAIDFSAMWRCHCGEMNLNTHTHCRECSGPRLTHEEKDHQPRSRERPKTVNVGFFGMGMGDDRGREESQRRIMTEQELDAYYRRSRQKLRLQWFLYAVGAVLALLLLVWQVSGPEY